MPMQEELIAIDEPSLVEALEGALLVAEPARTVNYGLFFQLLALRDRPESAPIELRELLSVVQSTPAMALFDHAHQFAIGRSVSVDFRFLVGWMISRGQQVGASQTVSDMVRYLQSETIELKAILAIDGFRVERNHQLGESELLPWEDVAMTDTKWRIGARLLFGGTSPTAALIQTHQVRRTHLRPWDSPPPYVSPSIEPALDVLRCVTAVAGAGFRLIHYWIEPPEWAPWAVELSSFGIDATAIPRQIEFSEAVVPELRESVSRLRSMDEICRQRLRVPLDRLNRSYLSGFRSVDTAIDLGIALESVYAPTKLSEGIAFAVRTRAARFLGGSPSERVATVRTIRDVYDLRSRAVHAGRFDGEGAPAKWRDDARIRTVLEEGQRLVGRSLSKVISEGEPDWEQFDIENLEPASSAPSQPVPRVNGSDVR